MRQGYPFFVSGHSASVGKFFSTYVSLPSHEDTSTWKSCHNFIKNIVKVNPRYEYLIQVIVIFLSYLIMFKNNTVFARYLIGNDARDIAKEA